jgi:RHS repeat-associated protein
MTRPNNVATSYSYDNLSHLLSTLHQLSGSTIDGASYTLDSAGNRTAKTDDYASVTSNYTYDSIYELTQVTQGGSTTESYSYDAVGNRTASLGMSSYTNNSSNELTATSNASYTYDNNGNTTSKTDSTGTTSYTWDYENRLSSVSLPSSGGTIAFKYDPTGRRIQKTFTTGSTTTNYLYDEANDIEEVNASGSILARYTQTQSPDEPLAESRSGTTSFYEADDLGSVTSLSNSAGTIANSYTYDSFGKLTASTGSITNSLQYTGRDFDSETGLRYYRARSYNPTVGRFISEDPIELHGGINLYAYVGNNPVSRIDPFGLDWLNQAADFSAGAGSVLTFGMTDMINNATGASSVVNKCSVAHMLGKAAGIGLFAAAGGALGAEAAEANAGEEGYEFSHWIPNRMGGPRSIWNGNYVSEQMHYLTDPFRFPSGWQAYGPKLNPVAQQILRIPYPYVGGAAGALVGGASALAGASCGCN